ncbi:MAG: hypothetical protein WA484_15735 [Solirubrobacteraceae bacterium]
MGPTKAYALRSVAPLALIAALAPGHSLLAATHSPIRSRELWATVDVCGPKDQPNTIGVRGSMPGDGHAKDIMYMRVRVQYLDATAKWVNLGKGDSGPLKLGSGALARQGGFSVELAPNAGASAFTLRGYVIFQWRRRATVIQSATRLTTSGHTSAALADPRGFSAATCKLT